MAEAEVRARVDLPRRLSIAISADGERLALGSPVPIVIDLPGWIQSE